jgi:hypothetical protein
MELPHFVSRSAARPAVLKTGVVTENAARQDNPDAVRVTI